MESVSSSYEFFELVSTDQRFPTCPSKLLPPPLDLWGLLYVCDVTDKCHVDWRLLSLPPSCKTLKPPSPSFSSANTMKHFE